jgi:hypothetical protein
MMKKYGITKESQQKFDIDQIPKSPTFLDQESNEWLIVQQRQIKNSSKENEGEEDLLIQHAQTGEQKEIKRKI